VPNLTIAVDGDVLKRARLRAVEEGTSVNAILRRHLEAYAATDQAAIGRRIVELSKATSSGSGSGGRQWTRDDLHER
jgi:hypothetical protein